MYYGDIKWFMVWELSNNIREGGKFNRSKEKTGYASILNELMLL
jgi:hypothetical protein